MVQPSRRQLTHGRGRIRGRGCMRIREKRTRKKPDLYKICGEIADQATKEATACLQAAQIMFRKYFAQVKVKASRLTSSFLASLKTRRDEAGFIYKLCTGKLEEFKFIKKEFKLSSA